MDLDAYRAQAQAFAADLNRAHLRRFAGLDGDWDPGAIHARHAELFADRAVDALREAAAEASARGDGDGPRRLLRFAVEGRLGAATARADAARAQAEAQEGLADLTAALEAESDLAARVELEERRLDIAVRRLTAPAAEALDRVRAEARALGWPSARAMLSAIHGVDLGAVAAEAEALLRETQPPQLDSGDGGSALARHDLPRVHRAAWADELLPAQPLEHLRATLTDLGLDAAFTIDAIARRGKSPRAFCAAVHVPHDVHLVVAPRDGLPGLEALFHEAGHALHLSHRNPDAPFEDRHLIDRARCEALAFAFEALATSRATSERLTAHRTALAGLRARRLAAALLHDLDLLDEGPHPALRERYARRMAAATGLAWPSAPWLTAADPLLSSADYLRALGQASSLPKQTLILALQN